MRVLKKSALLVFNIKSVVNLLHPGYRIPFHSVYLSIDKPSKRPPAILRQDKNTRRYSLLKLDDFSEYKKNLIFVSQGNEKVLTDISRFKKYLLISYKSRDRLLETKCILWLRQSLTYYSINLYEWHNK